MTSNKKKILYIGSVQMSAEFLSVVIKDSRFELCGLVTKNSSRFNADFYPLAERVPSSIPVFYFENNLMEMETWIRNQSPDVIFCFGWSHILPKELLKFPKLGTLGFHPTLLPANRGRHPLIWAIVLGLQETGSTFFMMEGGVDDGDIVSQKKILLAENETAASLYQKVIDAGVEQVAILLNHLEKGEFKRIPQNHSFANSWRKRSVQDGVIDWRMSAESIDRLVRGLGEPYIGAEFVYKDQIIKVWETKIISSIMPVNREPGFVLESDAEVFTVKCGYGALKVLKHSGAEIMPNTGDYL